MRANKIPSRIVVHSKDVENITGISHRAACRLLQLLRLALGKPKGAFITIKEFSAYTGIDENLLKEFLK